MLKIALFYFAFVGGMEAWGAQDISYSCGIAKGFPPYQYVDSKGQSAGLDVEVANIVFKTAGIKVNFVQDNWESLLSNLIYNKKSIQMLSGAEITDERKKFLNFTVPYYKRRSAIFTLKGSPYKKIEDFYGKIVTGDIHSSFETSLGEKRDNIRITKTSSKEESFRKLKEKSVVAVIAPIEVGYRLARELDITVDIIEQKYPGSDVAFAVRKDNVELLNKLNTALNKLIKSGEIEKILKKY